MSFEYNYTRDIITDIEEYDINNPFRKDIDDKQIFLSKEIESLLPGKQFKIICLDMECKIIFDDELSLEEEIDLDNVVFAHKNNI